MRDDVANFISARQSEFQVIGMGDRQKHSLILAIFNAGMMELLPVCLHHKDKAGLESTHATVAEGPPF